MEHSKTMIRSILGGDAAYGLVLVPIPDEARLIQSEQIGGGRARLDDITREHLILMSSRGAPLMVILSKADKASREDLALVDNLVRETLKEIGKIPVNVRSGDELPPVVKEIGNGVIVPVLQFAATDLSSMSLLVEVLRLLPVSTRSGDPSGPARAYVDKVYRGIRGTNVVVTGTVMSGVFKTGQTVVIGPGQNEGMSEGRLFSIEMFNKRVFAAKSGDPFGFDIKEVDKHQVRRGQIVTDPGGTIGSCRIFEANIVVTRHPTRISEGYAPVLQCHTIQQTVILRTIYGSEFLCVGDFARVRLEFMMGPEALQIGDRIVLREANTRAIGTIVDIVS